jgi:hypothetical protein
VDSCNVEMPSQDLEYLSRYLPDVESKGARTPDLFDITNTAFSKARIGEADDEEEWMQEFADMVDNVRAMPDFSDDGSDDDGSPTPPLPRGKSCWSANADQMCRPS